MMNEVEIKDFIGIQASNRLAPVNAANELVNLDLRSTTGELVSRKHSYIYMSPPDIQEYYSDIIGSVSYIGFTTFFIDGEEVILLVQKGTIKGYTGIGIFNTILFWVRYKNEWVWLNEMRLIPFGGISGPPTMPNNLNGNFIVDAGLPEHCEGWIVSRVVGYAISTSHSEAKILKRISTREAKLSISSPNFGGMGHLLIQKNYLPGEVLNELYNVLPEELTFHKILNDLRIGFGGKANRAGIMIGLRDSVFKVEKYECLNKTDQLIVDRYIPAKSNLVYSLEITNRTGSGFISGLYLLTGIVDGFEEVVLYETEYLLSPSIEIKLKLDYALFNKRITSFNVYASEKDIINYRLVKTFNIADTDFILRSDGYLLSNKYTDNYSISYQDALSTINETNTKSTSWVSSLITIEAGELSDYQFSIVNSYNNPLELKIPIYTNQANIGDTIILELDVKPSTDAGIKLFLDTLPRQYENKIGYGLISANQFNHIKLEQKVTFNVSELVIKIDIPQNALVKLDNLKYYKITDIIQTIDLTGNDLDGALNYDYKSELIKSWDRAVVSGGKTYFLNPYIDKRYSNKIFYSVIKGSGAFMYDVAPATNYIDLENFDGNGIIGIEVLKNMNLLVLRQNSVLILDPISNRVIQLEQGKGCISNRSIVNYGDKVIWCGENDIYVTDSYNIQSLTEGTIREEYRGLADKNKFIAVKDNEEGSYKLYVNNANVTEFIYTKRGWIKTKRDIAITGYANNKKGDVLFADSNGYINWEINTSLMNGFTFRWRSIEFDIALMNELKERDRIVIKSVWLNYSGDSSKTYKINIINDGIVKQILNIPGSKTYHQQNLRLLGACKRFQIELTGEDNVGEMFRMRSMGFSYKVVRVGRYA